MSNKPTILVVFGISGNLSRIKLLPAISQLIKSGAMPKDFKIVGVTRQESIDLDSDLDVDVFSMNILNSDDYEKLNNFILDIGKKFNNNFQTLFYLAIPPESFKDVIEFIGKSSLIKNDNKLLLEKPFGLDLESAKDLIDHINKYFSSDKIYRIDHYLAKETIQNLLVFRENNALFKNTWNNKFIEKIEIVASEPNGIDGRINFYEQTGALRDLIQSHLLQLTAIILMDSYNINKLDEIPFYRLGALKKLYIKDLNLVKRAQYAGYKQEVENNSNVETFVSLVLESKNRNWKGVPIKLITGKYLDKKSTLITIFYKKNRASDANKLTLQLQPNEEIKLSLLVKKPGYENITNCESLRFNFQENYNEIPQGYEHVLFRAINSDHSLFVSNEEVLETWRILEPIQKKWKKSEDDLIFYKPKSTIESILS